MTRYRNPHHNPRYPKYGPEFYETDVRPVEYRGYLIFNRFGCVFDVVVNSILVGTIAGEGAARRIVDQHINKLSPVFCPGTFWALPEGMNWDGLIAERKKWGIDPLAVPLGSAGGVTGWGRLLPCDYRVAA